MKYYSERQVKKLLKEQIRICSFTFDNDAIPMANLPKGKEGSVYTSRQLFDIKNYAINGVLNQMDFHLD